MIKEHEHEITRVWLLRDGKYQVTTSARKEGDTDSDKKGPLPCNDYLGDTLQNQDMSKDKRKNQVKTTAEKEDDTDSTATVTTAAVTSVCESE